MATDQQQFAQILGEYQDRVFRLCCAMLGDRALAEEAAQEAFVRIWKALPGFRGESTLSTWIYSIARNACLTARKSKAFERGLSLELPGVRFAAERARAEAPDRSIDILRYVAELPPHYREVILLFHMQEKSYEEVSAMLDLPLGTVKTYLHRARKQLAEALAAGKQPRMTDGGSR
ncbi:MAG: RNA polymerase sigma factor [Acidobacteria bacterium]|nr:RNA polymerase sigma factor [Acidobacteriota bacterium]